MYRLDKTSKRYLSDPARFADVVNVYCHEGRQVVKAEDISGNIREEELSYYLDEDMGTVNRIVWRRYEAGRL